MKKRSYLLIALTATVLLYVLIEILAQNQIEFIKVEAYTEIDTKNSFKREVYIIPSPPGNIAIFQKELEKFNANKIVIK